MAMSEQDRSCKPIEQLLIEKSGRQRLKSEQKERQQAEMERWMRNVSKVSCFAAAECIAVVIGMTS